VIFYVVTSIYLSSFDRLDDVEAKLIETEKEADKARKDSKSARDEFNDIKQRRCVADDWNVISVFINLEDASCSTKHTLTYQSELIKSIKT
jgi:hypothetical protein